MQHQGPNNVIGAIAVVFDLAAKSACLISKFQTRREYHESLGVVDQLIALYTAQRKGIFAAGRAAGDS